jgi:hypothetical protein
VALAGLALSACGGPPAPPFATAPSDAAVADALTARVEAPDTPDMAVRPGLPGDTPHTPSCQDSYRVDQVSVKQQPQHDAYGYRVKVDASYQVTRLLPDTEDTVIAGPNDCFGYNSNNQIAWNGGAATIAGGGAITWRGSYWLLNVGDEYIPMSPGPEHAFVVQELKAP